MNTLAATFVDRWRSVPGFLIAIGGILSVDSALGATPEAWAAYRQEVVTACAAASKLRDPKLGGSPVEFDDRLGLTAVIIDGYYPQPHMKNKRGRVLCLFDRRTRTAVVSEADSIARRREP
jgi:hypothetical protein